MGEGFDLKGLQLGVATAATQIEGGDVRSNWTDWAERPGTIRDGSTCLRATDHWRRWREDTELMAALGIQLYRMSVDWARVEPTRGEFDETAIEHYRAELELLRRKGIRPMITLYHFSHPLWFEQAGGWLATEALLVWERFVRRMVQALGDLVEDWVTINEPNVYAVEGYFLGVSPPGVRRIGTALRVKSILAVAHIRAYRIVHEVHPGRPMVGPALHLRAFQPLDPGNPFHRLLTPVVRQLFQGAIIPAVMSGVFRPPLRPPRGVDVRPGRYADFVGLNYYARTSVAGLRDGTRAGVQVNDLGWEVYAAGLGELATWAWETYRLPVWITENGTCDHADAFRSRYVADHLRVISEVRAAGVPVDRYYHWCFVDNWEWTEGEAARFGLVALDYETQKRTVRESGRFFAEVIAAGGVTDAMLANYVAAQTYPLADRSS